MAVTQHRHHHEPPPPPPESGSIVKGKVSRIESYGAFISILTPSSSSRFCHRGLLHISQLSSYKVDSVGDCLELDDEIYVKVLHCEEEENEQQQANFDDEYSERRQRQRDDRRDRRKRYKISLSLKYASQDGSFTDLDPNNEQYHKETRGRKNGGDGQNSSRAPTKNAPSSLETSLNSQIGMGMAIDPLAAMQQVSSSNSANRLILRDSGKKKVMINGYELLDDNEGEIDIPPPRQSQGPAVVPYQANSTRRPIGRGRGSTLPSWMTQSSQNDGIQSNPKNKEDDISCSSLSNADRRGKRKKKDKKKDDRKKKKKRKRHKYDEDYSEEDSVKKSSRRKHHHKRHKSKSKQKHSRSRYLSGDDDDDLSRSRSRSRSRDEECDGDDERHNSRKRSKSRSKAKKKHRRKDDYYSSDDDDDDDDRKRRSMSQNSQDEFDQESSGSGKGKTDSEPMFKSIAEAKELIKKLESSK